MKTRGMFRIYQCSRCKNIGFVPVENEEAEAHCSLCKGMILHERGTLYAATIDEAREIMTDLAVSSRLESKKGGSTRGIGLKKRVLNIVEAIVEINRGRPASLEQVMRECSEAGIDLGRASHFVNQLKSEGLLSEIAGGLMINDGGIL